MSHLVRSEQSRSARLLINTPLPAIADAVYNAVGKRFYELPITPEQIARAAAEKLGEDLFKEID